MVRRIHRVDSPAAANGLPRRLAGRSAFTLIEMLIAMAITLVMMAAVATLFANVSNSVRNRRATVEMTNQVRHVRNVLQQDLQGATCPGLTWQRPEANHGYIEIIEGQYRDYFPSYLTDNNLDTDGDGNPGGNPDELDPSQSIVPRNNLAVDSNGNGRIDADEWEAHYRDPSGRSFTQGSGLGDYDDILMLTVRNENEPFVGRMPTNVRNGNNAARFDVDDNSQQWGYQTLESTLAEVVWFAVENPDADNDADGFFGEPGMRTIYRRTLLIAPWLNPYRDSRATDPDVFNDGRQFKAEPGLVRLLPDEIDFNSIPEAIAAIIAFQDRYDLSVRLEWDPNIGSDGRWKIMANTLGDLTKRENRFGHFGYFPGTNQANQPRRVFPYAFTSWGSGYGGESVRTVVDSEASGGPDTSANVIANLGLDDSIASYRVDATGAGYATRPFVFVEEDCSAPATAQAMLNDDGAVVRVVHGPVPLWGKRRGEDVMMTDALAFDVRVYDPGAPLFGAREIPGDNTSQVSTILEPSDRGWLTAYLHPDNFDGTTSMIGTDDTSFPYSGQGAYVDLGYGFYPPLPQPPDPPTLPYLMALPAYHPSFSSSAAPWFFANRGLSDVFGRLLAPGYSVYDTWSYHYENNGRDDDGDGSVDEGNNGLDEPDFRTTTPFDALNPTDIAINGPDDVGERETAPPYDKPLRGAQVLIRTYERDSRAIRQVRVSQHFMPE